MFQEINNLFNQSYEDRTRDRAGEAPYSALVIYHKQYYGKGWAKFFNFCKPVLIVAVIAATIYFVSEIGLDEFMNNLTAWQLFGAICIFVMCVALALDCGDSQDTEKNLIFTDKGLTVVIPGDYSSRGLTTWEGILRFFFFHRRRTAPEKVVKYPPFASSPEDEMAWSNFRSYSIIHHQKRGNVSIKFWLVDDPKSGSQKACHLRKNKLDCIEIYLRDDGGRYTGYYDEKNELDTAVKFLNERVSLPLYSEDKLKD